MVFSWVRVWVAQKYPTSQRNCPIVVCEYRLGGSWAGTKVSLFDSPSLSLIGLIPFGARLHLVSLVVFHRHFLRHTLTTSLFHLPNDTRCFPTCFHDGCLLSLTALQRASPTPTFDIRTSLSVSHHLSLATSVAHRLCRSTPLLLDASVAHHLCLSLPLSLTASVARDCPPFSAR
jgi:hypothetical protein